MTATSGLLRVFNENVQVKIQEFKSSLAALLVDACRSCLKRIMCDTTGEHLYAFSIYCASGCTSMGVAASTIETIERRKSQESLDELQAFIYRMNAAEWQYVNLHWELFEQSNRLIDEFYECLYDGGFEDYELSEDVTTSELGALKKGIFVEIIITVLRMLKESGEFVRHGINEDLLLGLQFGDPSARDVLMMEEVSEHVNSPFWHSQVMRNSRYLLRAE